jgi:hypothetical protein
VSEKKPITFVWITTQFVGYHRWKDAPEEVDFLRNWHRHIFHVRVGVEVSALNREVEFFILKKKVDEFLKGAYEGKTFEASCEMIANVILNQFKASVVTVSEDNENGATAIISGRPEDFFASILNSESDAIVRG